MHPCGHQRSEPALFPGFGPLLDHLLSYYFCTLSRIWHGSRGDIGPQQHVDPCLAPDGRDVSCPEQELEAQFVGKQILCASRKQTLWVAQFFHSPLFPFSHRICTQVEIMGMNTQQMVVYGGKYVSLKSRPLVMFQSVSVYSSLHENVDSIFDGIHERLDPHRLECLG